MFDLSKKFRFRNFRVYRDSLTLIKEFKGWAKVELPLHERFGLRPQFCRALDSIVLNIAEGSERRSDKDFAHFLTIANSSLNEVVACLDIALTERYLPESRHADFLKKAAFLSNQVSAFRDTLLKSKVKGQTSKAPVA